ncbi:hypothetical protein HET69_12910 [Streptomyces sp. CJ_13]|uniref:hypothetical protein n=1 Tax=Streptomyces sp. CJ_13 TaxID=2724943 RepID=UPI001BDCD281|nr:hypothetical protein [Streptomyces sp. CJ_13]MBT1184903.1 hypothetical protein [Streptomyces sp. CJ_13]
MTGELHTLWREVTGDAADWVRPSHIDSQRRLHVHCMAPAWTTATKITGRSWIERWNSEHPSLPISGLVTATAIRVLVIGPDKWPHVQPLIEALERVKQRASQLHGQAPLVFAYSRLDPAGRHAGVWARTHRLHAHDFACNWEVCVPECPSEDPEHRLRRADGSSFCRNAGRRQNRHLIDIGAELIVACVPSKTPSRLRADLQHAHDKGVPVWRVHEPAG